MALPKPHPPARLFVAVLAARVVDLDRLRGRLAQEFGPTACEAGPWAHDYTRYYEPESGPDLRRWLAGFAGDFDAGTLAAVKHRTNALEAALRTEVLLPGIAAGDVPARPVNLDPGYLTEGKVVLATCKDRDHRLWIGEGIYAEVTLHRHAGAWADRPWTYPDWRDARTKAFCEDLRTHLRSEATAPVRGRPGA